MSERYGRGAPRRFRPDELDTELDPGEEAGIQSVARDLEWLAATDDVGPSWDFTDRVMASIASEPLPRPVVAAFGAARKGRPLAALAALGDLWRVAFGGGARPLAVRLPAMALVVLLFVGVAGAGTLGVGALAGILNGRPSPTPVPTPISSQTLENPEATPTPPPTPEPSDGPSTEPSPGPSTEPSDGPDESASPTPGTSPAETPDDGGGMDTGSAPLATDTPRALGAPRVPGTPRATRRPTRTPTPTDGPRPTETNDSGRTPRPTEEPDHSATPSPTDRHGNGSGGDDGNAVAIP